MKFGFIFTLFALSTLICATYTAPTSSQIQQEKELLKLLDHIARSQQVGEGASELVEAQFLGKILGSVGKLFKSALGFFGKHKKGILKGAGRLAGRALNGFTNRGFGSPYPPSPYPPPPYILDKGDMWQTVRGMC